MGEPRTEYHGSWVADGLLAVVALTPVVAAQCLKRMALYRELHRKDDRLSRLCYFDDTDLRFFSLDNYDLHGATRAAVEVFLARVRAADTAPDDGDSGFFLLSATPPAAGDLRMGYVVLNVDGGDLFWSAQTKHGTETLETGYFYRNQLEAIAGPPPS